MAVNKVTICSNALLMLGDKPISSMTQLGDRVVLASNTYEMMRDRLLRAHPWNCAIKRVVLAPDANAPEFGYTAKFLLPSDWLKTLQVGRTEDCRPDFLAEGRYILCNTDALYLRYVFRNDNEGTWDSLLIEAMTVAMAAVFAYPITESTSLRESFYNELQQKLKEARAVDGQDEPPETFGDFPLLQARVGGYRGW